MKCTSCGVEVKDGDAFCASCGIPMGGTAPRASGAKEEEKLLWRGSYSPKGMVGSWIVALIVAALSWIVGGKITPGGELYGLLWGGGTIFSLLLIKLFYRRLSVSYDLTSQRFIHRVGILSQVTDRIEVIDIDDVIVEQNILQRLIGVGTIKVLSRDLSHPALTMVGISGVAKVADLMDRARREERRRRGLYLEST